MKYPFKQATRICVCEGGRRKEIGGEAYDSVWVAFLIWLLKKMKSCEGDGIDHVISPNSA